LQSFEILFENNSPLHDINISSRILKPIKLPKMPPHNDYKTDEKAFTLQITQCEFTSEAV